MGKLRAVLENHPIFLGFASGGNYFLCSLELGNAFLVLRFFVKKKMKASGRKNYIK